MAYNKKYAELGESVIDYVNDREDAIGSEFSSLSDRIQGIYSGRIYALSAIDDRDLYLVHFDGTNVSGSPATGWFNSWGFNSKDRKYGVQYAFSRFGDTAIHWVRFKIDGDWSGWRRTN